MLDSIIVWAMETSYSPSKIWEYDLESERKMLYQFGRLDNPDLGYDYDADYHILGVSQFINNPNLLRYHRKMGETRISLKRVSIISDSLNFVYNLKILFYKTLLANFKLKVMQRRLKTLDSLISMVRKGLKIGKFPRAHLEALLAKKEHMLGQMEILKGEYQGYISRLSVLVGRNINGIDDTLPPPPDLPPPESLYVIIDSSPLIKEKATRILLLKAQEGYYRASVFPGLQVFTGYYRYRDIPIGGVTFGVSFPVPVFNNNRGFINSTRYTIKRERADSAYTHTLLMGRLMEISSTYSAILKKLQRIDSVEIPRLKRAYTITIKAYISGAVGYTEVFTALESLLDAEIEKAELLIDAWGMAAEVERTLGIELR